MKLPLRVLDTSETVVDADGAAVAHFYHGTTPEHRRLAHAAALAFVACWDGVCPERPKGERCSLPAGHDGHCRWANGD